MRKSRGVLGFVVGLGVLFGACAYADQSSVQEQNKIQSVRTIPYPVGYDITSQGASAYLRRGDHYVSPYFAHPDYFNMTSTNYRTVVANFKTYQQTKEYSCGPAAVLMVLYYYHVTNKTELQLVKVLKSNYDWDGDNIVNPGLANEDSEVGTSTASITSYLRKLGWHVESSLEAGQQTGYSFKNKAAFQEWIIRQLKSKRPVLVEWEEWGGHWQVIIGYDTMGTAIFGDDILIMADPYDTADHFQDGYSVVAFERFYKMWHDENATMRNQQWVLAYPKK